jgi:1,4-dihydroxy-2-naphthoate octaprenyltransferase
MYLHRLLLAIFVVGTAGTAVELLLLGHFEDAPQFVPLILLAAGIVIALWYGKGPTPLSIKALRTVLVLFVGGGLLGLLLHYRGNVEFEVERDPSIGGLSLFWEAITGATPALAPASMILLAAIGYAVLKSRS